MDSKSFVALTLGSSELTLRDVQHLLAWTSQYLHGSEPDVWQKNKAGFYVSEDFGFGLMDAYNLVTMALTFSHVPPMSTCTIDIIGGYWSR